MFVISFLLYVCTYVCMCVFMYVCMYVSMYSISKQIPVKFTCIHIVINELTLTAVLRNILNPWNQHGSLLKQKSTFMEILMCLFKIQAEKLIKGRLARIK